MRNKYKIAIIILAVLIVTGIIAALVQKNAAKETASTDVEAVVNVTIPDVKLFCGKTQIAHPTGYTMNMDAFYMRDNLAVVENGSVSAEIETNGAKVKSIAYQVKSISGTELLDDNTVKNYEESDGVIKCEISITSIAEKGEEYILILALETEDEENVYYYSRITEPEENIIEDQAAFALEFDELTYMHEDASDLYYYLESDSSFDNTNLGYVTLKSNFDQITWGSLNPEKVTEPEIALKEINILEAGSTATFELTYKIKSGDEGDEDYYNVTEDITVWTYYGTMHVLAYERTVEEIFEPSDDNITSSRIYLGIHESTTLDYVQSDDSRYFVFASGDSIWKIDTQSKEANRMFTLYEENSSECEIIPISVDEDGNTEFATIGYVASGAHCGKSGIGVYSYDGEKDEVTENIFIPYDRPYEVLNEEAANLYYINDSVLYVMMYDSVQYVNMVTKEHGTLVNGLHAGNYALSSSKDYIAYNTDKSLYGSDSITVLHLDNMEEYTIDAGEGNKIRVLGYSGENLVYGIAKNNKITQNESGDTVFAMSEINITNSDNELVKNYSKKGVYITDVTISDNMINLKRVKNDENIDDDQLIDNTEKIDPVLEVSYWTDSAKKRILTLVLTNAMSSTSELKVTKTADCNMQAQNDLVMDIEQNDMEKYFVYALGRLRGIYDSLSEAKQTAKEYCGTVIDSTGSKEWVFEQNYKESE